MLCQKACFNSPVWFNVGVKEGRGYGWVYDHRQDRIGKLEHGVTRPQCSACFFIVSVRDSLESILDLAKTEGMLFMGARARGRTCRRCARKTPFCREAAGLPVRCPS